MLRVPPPDIFNMRRLMTVLASKDSMTADNHVLSILMSPAA